MVQSLDKDTHSEAARNASCNLLGVRTMKASARMIQQLHQRQLSLSPAALCWQKNQDHPSLAPLAPPPSSSSTTERTTVMTTTTTTLTTNTVRTARRREASCATMMVVMMMILTVHRLVLLCSLDDSNKKNNNNNNEKTRLVSSNAHPSLAAFPFTQPSLALTRDKNEQHLHHLSPQQPQQPQQQHDHLVVVRNQRQQPQLGCQCTLPVCQTPFYCHRGIIQVHKMGVLLLHELVSAAATTTDASSRPFPGPVETAEIKGSLAPSFASLDGKHQQPHDYRHVLVTRNFYQALLSGYLYHKSHRECELDHWGHPSKRQRKEWLLQENWEERIWRRTEPKNNNNNNDSSSSSKVASDYYHHANSIRRRPPSPRVQPPWPPGRGRSLCTYLSDESEYHGLHVYMEWATALYLDPILAFAHYRRRAEHEDGRQRTLFWCYEDLIRQDGSVTVQRLSKWLFPAHPRNDTATATTVPLAQATRAPTEQRDQFPGHATTSDPVIRNRLLTIIQQLDHDMFHGTIESSNRNVFGCGVEI